MNDAVSDLDRFTNDLQATILRDSLDRYGPTVIDRWMNPRRRGPIIKPDGYARFKGPCGDTMQIWLQITGGRIEDASFMTDGCGSSIACGSAAGELARGRTVEDAVGIDQRMVLEFLGGLPQEEEHCALLAATTLSHAIAAYRTARER
jgi:nitrogen fixation NifU-like protein